MLPEESGYRIADSDRDRAVALLRTHCTDGRITLEEFADRVGAVYDARTSADLDAVLAGLPAPEPAPHPRFLANPQAQTRLRARKRWEVAVFGTSTLDLTDAVIDDASPAVNAVAVFGDVTIVVPEGVEVDMMGVAVFGDKRCTTGAVRPSPSSPVVHVRAVAVFGNVHVRPPRSRR